MTKHALETPNISQYFGNINAKNINITKENKFLKSIDGAIFTADRKNIAILSNKIKTGILYRTKQKLSGHMHFQDVT